MSKERVLLIYAHIVKILNKQITLSQRWPRECPENCM